ncbi:NUDIX hydrolase [Nitratireductor indicus]|uniref:NUDIX hydrolase n=1 Tax=Nitratireductor indicus C115 TaxID=1231190 RepID=K2P1K8_9HYPH|nr:NUDIX hydrolase [Nitratireductor indicus C115]SFQ11829.1 8-oxo-dGTP pyrophosphatase MutT, NUDIX family [Nitratireductor indicus]
MIISHCTRMRLTERVRRLFGGNPRRVQAAALPWRTSAKDGSLEIMLVTSRDTGRWVLPKGWPEGPERLGQTAQREAVEEAGIEGVAADTEIGRFYYKKLRGSGVEWRCEVAIIPLRVTRELNKWPERKKRTRRWFSARDAARLVDEPDLAEMLLRFADNPREIAA